MRKKSKINYKEIFSKRFGFFIGFYSVIVVAVTFVIMKNSYARYVANMDINVTSKTGEMICDLEVDNNSYIENNVPYFIITIKNYNANGDITATDVEYTLNVTNEDGSNGLFYYISEDDGSSSNDYMPSLTIQNLSFNKNKTTKKFKVFVKVQSSQHETVNFNVSLDAVQKEMA